MSADEIHNCSRAEVEKALREGRLFRVRRKSWPNTEYLVEADSKEKAIEWARSHIFIEGRRPKPAFTAERIDPERPSIDPSMWPEESLRQKVRDYFASQRKEAQ